MANYEDPFNDRTYVLPADLLTAASEAEADVRKFIQHSEHGFLLHRQITVLSFHDDAGKEEVSASDIVRLLSELRPRTFDSASGGPPQKTEISLTSTVGSNIIRFIGLHFDELRDLICNKKGLTTTTHGAIAGIAAWLISHLGVSEHSIATATATAILAAILTATKGAFCKMTAPEAKASLTAARKPRPRGKK